MCFSFPTICCPARAERLPETWFYFVGHNFLWNKKGRSSTCPFHTCARRFELPTPWSVAKCSIQLSYTHSLKDNVLNNVNYYIIIFQDCQLSISFFIYIFFFLLPLSHPYSLKFIFLFPLRPCPHSSGPGFIPPIVYEFLEKLL